MKIALIILAGLVALLLVVGLVFYLAGSRMPREHRSVVTATFKASRTAVWTAITDYAAMPKWWPAVVAIRTEKLPDGTELTWNKDKRGQEIAFRTAESRANEKLVRVIVGLLRVYSYLYQPGREHYKKRKTFYCLQTVGEK